MQASASQIARFLQLPLVGEDIPIWGIRSIHHLEANHMTFAKDFAVDLADKLNSVPNVLVLAPPSFEAVLQVSHILTSRPRLDFARAVRQFFVASPEPFISSTAVIAPSATIGKQVSIGHFSVVSEGVQIGDNTEIRDHVVLLPNTIIGARCVIKSHTLIGDEGFGFEFEDDGTPFRMPHLGRVVIGNDVEIGALNVIARGTIDDTVISDHVKTDDHVFVAHNVFVGENSVIIAGAEVSGSVKIGANVWVGPQACVLNKIQIGDYAFLGLGAVVTKSVEPNMVMVGNPARPLRKRYEDK